MTPDAWPSTAAQRRSWIAAIVRDIDERHATARRGVLTDLVRAAWPSWLSQDQ